MKRKIKASNDPVLDFKSCIQNMNEVESEIFDELQLIHKGDWESFLSGVIKLADIKNIDVSNLEKILEAVSDYGYSDTYLWISDALNSIRKGE